MKISKSDLRQIIEEEALRLYKLEKLEEVKQKVDQKIKVISEGKGKVSDEELEELWAGLKSVLGAGAKAVGQAVSAGVDKAQQMGQKIADKYKQGENQAKMEKLQKRQAEIQKELEKIDNELAALAPPAETSKQAKAQNMKTPAKRATPAKTSTTKTKAPTSTTSKSTATKTAPTKRTTSRATAGTAKKQASQPLTTSTTSVA